MFTYSSEDGDPKMDEAEEVRSGDEEAVEPEEEPEGKKGHFRNSNRKILSNHII